jgi:hypothetical protein
MPTRRASRQPSLTEDERRYEIFISSTYEDLRDERRRLENSILAQGHFPVGMERFAGGHEPQWSLIEQILDSADYYVLVVGGRYGTLVEKGDMSFTEAEFRHARETKKCIIVFMIDEDALSLLPAERREGDAAKQRMLERFRGLLETQYVHYWADADDLERKIQRVLPKWINENRRAGWVRYELYEQGIENGARVKQENEVLRYLLRHLLPDDHQLSLRFLQDLVPLDRTARVIRAIERMLEDYVFPMVKGARARVYFAYRLSEPVRPPRSRTVAHYRIGISTSEEAAWQEGLYVGEASNIHYVYSRSEANQIRDTRAPGSMNQSVAGERSVMTVPVRLGSESVGVLGFSSPSPKGTDVLKDLANEVATVFSALFYVFAQSVKRHSGSKGETLSDEQAAQRIREHLARAFAARFGSTETVSPSR